MTSPSRCTLCKSKAIIDPELNYTQNGEKLGVSRDTVRRHVEHIDEFFNIPNEIITSRGKSVRLPDGSWEKVSYNVNAKIALDASEGLEELVRDIFTQPLPKVSLDRRVGTATRVLQPTDLQVGKVDINGGTKEMMERVDNALAAFVEDLKESPVEELIIAETGDIIENFMNTSSQRETNDLHLINQILTAAGIISRIVRAVAPYAQQVKYIATTSNHCTYRVGFKSPASTPDNDFGLMIQEFIQRELEGRPEYAHVDFLKPRNPFEEFVVYHSEISNTTMLFAHGHHKNKAMGLGDLVKDWGAAPDSPIHPVQIAFFGHFHSFHLYNSYGRWIVVGPSCDGGSSWFTHLSGQVSKAGMLSMNVMNGMWFSPNIY